MKPHGGRRVWNWVRGPAALLVAALIPALFAAIFRGPRVFAPAVVEGLTFAVCVGGMAYVAFDRLGPRLGSLSHFQQWMFVIAVLVACSAAGTALAHTILTVAFQRRWSWPLYVRSFQISLLIAFLIGGASFVIERLRHRLVGAEQEAAEARRLATEAQLASLESRIRPHFLFNALNSIAALIREDPQAAERLVERLAALLRASLDQPSGLVPLAVELRVVADYLEIERARFGDRLRYSIDCPEALARSCQVPAMSVQTLVENAVKHAIAPRREGGEVHVRASRETECVRLDVVDNGPGFDALAFPPGHGIDILAGRLRVLFNGAAGLHFERRPSQMVASLVLRDS